MNLRQVPERCSVTLRFPNSKAFEAKIRFVNSRKGPRAKFTVSEKKNGRSGSAIEKCERNKEKKKERKKTSEPRRIAKNERRRSIRVLTTFSLTEFSGWRKAGAPESGSSCNRGRDCRRKFFGLSERRRVKRVTRLQRTTATFDRRGRFCEIEKSSYMQLIMEY